MMKHVSVLVKPASSMCNMRCTYCFYFNVSSMRDVESYGRMTPEVTEKMIENIYADLNNGDSLTIAFQGGEPTVAGLHYYEHLVSVIKKQEKLVNVSYAIQTNGTLINDKWAKFLKKHHFLVGLSIDGPEALHDSMRLSTKKNGTFSKVWRAKELFDEYGIEYNVLSVLTEKMAQQPNDMYDFFKQENINYVQFIPCLDELDKVCYQDYALTPKSFASFYQTIFSLWLEDLKNGKYVSIKLFDDIFNLFVRGEQTACGILGNCQIQYVIEADGSVYPCDFYVLDEYRMGYIQEQTLKELFEQDMSFKFLCDKPALSDYCQDCPFIKRCQGGCKRMKDAMYVDQSEMYCGYQSLLSTFLPNIPTILESLERGIA